MKTYIALVRDHSGSMSGIANAAKNDFNKNVDSIRENAIAQKQDTLVSVVEFGRYTTNNYGAKTVVKNASVTRDLSINYYPAEGGTPLYDAVGEAIDVLQQNHDANDPQTAFLVVVTTDGGENQSIRWNAYTMADRMRDLTKTDRWTFVFRVPREVVGELIRAGIPAGNILAWDASKGEAEVLRTTAASSAGYASYFASRSLGKTSVQTFFADMSNVSSAQVDQSMKDISKEVSLWPVSKAETDYQIRPFVESRLKKVMMKGAAFYQLTKTEPVVQDYKVILVRDKKTNAIYAGREARQILNLPQSGNIKLAPKKGGLENFEVFVQSTSVNRKLVPGTQVVYWEGANA